MPAFGYRPRIDGTNRQYFDHLRRACLLLPWHLLGLEVSGRRARLPNNGAAGGTQRRPNARPTKSARLCESAVIITVGGAGFGCRGLSLDPRPRDDEILVTLYFDQAARDDYR